MADVIWQKSSHCPEASACMSVATGPDGTILLRESDAPGTLLSTSPHQLRMLIATVRCMPHPAAR